MNKTWLKILVAVSGIMIAGSAAFFSVTGLGVLFSGAAFAVMVMAGSLEFAKLVTATYLKQEWDNIKGVNKWYLTTAVVILMAITSAGIFGYLSNAFQQQNLKLEQVSREISVWDNKIKTDSSQIVLLTNQLNQLQSNNTTVLNKNTNRSSLKFATSTSNEQSKIRNKIGVLNDSIVVYNAHINDIKNNNINLEKEVGGFRFVAESFNVPLNTVVKFFIILIVIVFDPLAVALIIAFNGLMDIKKEKLKNLEDFVDNGGQPLKLSKEDLKKLEEALLNPPPPNEELKKAAEQYKEVVKQKPWSNLPDDMWERMQKIEAAREEIHGPILPEDEPTGALANSRPRERMSFEDEISEREPFEEMLIKENNERMDIIGQNGNEGLHYDNEPLYDENGELTDRGERIENKIQEETFQEWLKENDNQNTDEEISTIEPTEEEESRNFSTIEPQIENIFQDEEEDLYWEGDTKIPVSLAVPEVSEVLTEFQDETFSEQPIRLEIPEVSQDTTPFVELPEEETPSVQPDEEKKNP